MSNTTITPSIGSTALAGVAAAMALAVSPPQNGVALNGIAPTVTAVNSVAPRGGLPVSWSALAAGAAGAATPALPWIQARLNVSGAMGSYGSVVIEGSKDGISWTPLAVVNDLTRSGARLYSGYGGVSISVDSPGVIILSNTGAIDADFYPRLRPRVINGDATTSVNVVGNVSTTGAV